MDYNYLIMQGKVLLTIYQLKMKEKIKQDKDCWKSKSKKSNVNATGSIERTINF